MSPNNFYRNASSILKLLSCCFPHFSISYNVGFSFAFPRYYGFCFDSLCTPVLEALEKEGLILFSQDAVELTPKGILYGDYSGKCIAEHLKQYF
ncbi:MAG: hypothetical protein D3903_04100 [Candidatus Electrothrix sp. GM3_4]|nr:hypothetical protein [Candidatus Electrothrix sp. GM3_4]